MRALAPAAAGVLAAALLAAGCGGILAPDLFLVERSGAGTHLTILVNEEGGVRCNGARTLKLSDPAIVQARAIQEELHEATSAHLSLPARPGSVFAYHVRDAEGSATFADNSTGQPHVLRSLALFVVQTAQQVCHVAQ